MLVHERHSDDRSVEVHVGIQNPTEELWRIIEAHQVQLNRSRLSNTHFSLSVSHADVSQHPLVRSADLLNLHWVADWLGPASFAKLQSLGKAIVWTLHDQRAFTGGCHFSAGCDRYKSDCAPCPQLLKDEFGLAAAGLEDQRTSWDPDRVVVVTPSHWLARCARQSSVFRETRVEVIPYGVDTDSFRPGDASRIRQKWGFGRDSFLLLMGADFGGEKRKGLHLLMESIKVSTQQLTASGAGVHKTVELACFGHFDGWRRRSPVAMRELGYITSDGDLSDLYSAADLFVLPSLEDNLPNTMLEALSCGTPVAAFPIGGIPDVIRHGETGFLARTASVDGLAAVISEAVAAPQRVSAMRDACRATILGSHSLAAQAHAYLALYNELLARGPWTEDRLSTCFAKPKEFERIAPALLGQSLREVRRLRLRNPHRRKARSGGYMGQLNALRQTFLGSGGVEKATYDQLTSWFGQRCGAVSTGRSKGD